MSDTLPLTLFEKCFAVTNLFNAKKSKESNNKKKRKNKANILWGC